MDDSHLESAWIARLKQGDPASAEEIWKRYYERLVRLARQKLAAGRRRAADEEDIVLSAFDSFFRGAQQQRFPRLEDRHDLWQLLLMLTVRKIADRVRYERRQKRGGGLVRGESAFSAGRNEYAVLGKTPSPELTVEVADELEHLLGLLDDDRTRAIALRKLEGQSNHQIADELPCALRTVERKLRLIRNLWKDSLSS
jgi:DNA-directed RNA polymerase specialized sigma24 family protein